VNLISKYDTSKVKKINLQILSFGGLTELYDISVSKYENDVKQRIKSARINDEKYIKKETKLQKNEEKLNKTDLSLDKNGFLRLNNRLYVPNSTNVKSTILDEFQKRWSFCHPGYHNMIKTLRKLFYWPNMKNETNAPDGVTHGDAFPHGSASSHILNVVGLSPSLQHLRW
jgi:hypothetical protein